MDTSLHTLLFGYQLVLTELFNSGQKKRNSNLQNPVGGSSPRYEMYYVMKVDLALLMEFKKGPPSSSKKRAKAAQRLGNKASLNADSFVWYIR